MATLDEIPPRKVINRHHQNGVLTTVTIQCGHYWAEFGRGPEGKIGMRRKGEMRDSRAYPSIPDRLYRQMYRRAVCEFRPAKPEAAPKPPPVKPDPVIAPASVKPARQLDMFVTPPK